MHLISISILLLLCACTEEQFYSVDWTRMNQANQALQPKPQPQLDDSCVRRCEASGSGQDFCESKCSY